MSSPPDDFASLTNARLAGVFAEIAALLRMRRADRFRVRTYRDAGRLIAGLPVDVATLDPEQLLRLRGVGRVVAGLVAQYLATGRSAFLDELREGEPEGLGVLIQVQGVSPRIGRALAADGVRDLPGLTRLVYRGELADIAGVGPVTAEVIAEGLRRFDLASGGRLFLRQARQQAEALAAALQLVVPDGAVHVAGDVRRGVAQPAGMVLVGVHSEPALLLDAAAELGVVTLERGASSIAIVTDRGRHAAVEVAAPGTTGTALVVATGAAPHVAWLRDRGLPDDASDERAAYAACGLAEVTAPPQRERADAGRPVVAQADLRGDLHVHSRFSGDGHDDLAALADAAAARGYAYLAVTDHAEDLRIVGIDRAAVALRDAELAAVNATRADVTLLRGLELNIGAEGDLDYDIDTRAAMDVNVASVHSLFRLPASRQTERILAAIADPTVDVIGHPTGRLLGVRPGYRIELAAIAEAAAETGVALEVNGSPRRLDLDAVLIEVALAAGARIAVNSDAHVTRELDYVVESTLTAQRGGAATDQVVNALALDALRAWVAARRARITGAAQA